MAEGARLGLACGFYHPGFRDQTFTVLGEPFLKVAEARRLERRCPGGRLVSTEVRYHYATLPFESGRRGWSRTTVLCTRNIRPTVVLHSEENGRNREIRTLDLLPPRQTR